MSDTVFSTKFETTRLAKFVDLIQRYLFAYFIF